MSREVHVVCRPELAPGMRLVGIPVHPASDRDAARAVVDRLRGEGRAALVLLEDRLAGEPPAGLPLVIPFPGPIADGRAATDPVVELLRRAIGYRVRLK